MATGRGAWFARRMEALDIRPATRDDLPAVVEIYNEAVRNTTGTYDAEPHTLEQRMAWLEHYEAKGFPVLVENSGRAWGSLSPFVERPGFKHTAVCSVYVAEMARGQGLGTGLLEALLGEGIRRGLHTVLAAVDGANEASLRLHEKLGFTRVGCFLEIAHKDGRWYDVVYLQRML